MPLEEWEGKMEPQNVGTTRNAGVVILLGIITLGIYAIYWYYSINREIKEHDPDQHFSPGGAAVAVFIPIANIVSEYNTASRIRRMQKADNLSDIISPGAALAWYIFFGIGYVITVQGALNDHWYEHSKGSQ